MKIDFRVLDFLRGRKRDYMRKFPAPEHDPVLRDLAKFCRADRTTYDPDPRTHAALEGRREVWLRIQNHLNLNSRQLYAIYNLPAVSIAGQTEDDE